MRRPGGPPCRNEDTAYGFDAAGNLTNDGTFTYNFDAEERISSFNLNSNGSQVANYVYDADGNRVRKNVGSGWTEYMYFGSNIIAENSPSGWTDYIFAGGKRIAQVSSGGTQYYWGDHLGTTKMTLDASGNSQCYAIYTPFGSEVSGCPTHYKFTGKERDYEDGLDYFGARYYSSNMGRWMSPDWAEVPMPVPYGTIGNPQSLNLYGYVLNNPLSSQDIDGHGCDAVRDLCRAIRDAVSEGRSIADGWQDRLIEIQDNLSNGVQSAKKDLDTFNSVLGFGKTNCGGGGDCINAIGLAATAVIAAVASDAGSEGPFVERQIATAGRKIQNLAALLTDETLEAANREINGGMRVLKSDGTPFEHVPKVEQVINGLNRQAKHLERVLQRSGLSDSQIGRINDLIERARGLMETGQRAITKDPI